MSHPTSPHADNRPLGIALMILGMITMCVTDAAGKWVVQDYNVAQLNFCRGFFALLVLLPTARSEGGLTALKTKRPWAHGLRSGLLVCLAYAWFFGLAKLPLAEATAIGLCAPLCMTALSVVVLKEKVGPYRWGAVVLGFIGMLVIIRPGTAMFDPMFLFPVFAAVGYATYMLTNRILSRTETVTSITLYPQAAIFLVSAVIAPFVWQPVTATAFFAMAVTGLSAGLGHLLLSFAFRYASPSVLAPFDYTALVWAALFGWVLFRQLPDQVALVGMAFIVAAGLIVIYREAVAARRIVSVPLG
ncbi:MAG: DMT family transporter [Rhodospirillaceae bacterium]|nr:DMT family transporter [Rhodospirillaceae bacterium]